MVKLLILFKLFFILLLVVITIHNQIKREKRRNKVIAYFGCNNNSDLIFGVVFALMAFIAMLLWFNLYRELIELLDSHNYIQKNLQLFDKSYLTNMQGYLYRHDEFYLLHKINIYTNGFNYLVSVSIYLYLSIIVIFIGFQKGQITDEGISSVNYELKWDSIVDYSFKEKKKLLSNGLYYTLTISVKGRNSKSIIKILEKDKIAIEGLMSKNIIQEVKHE